MLARAKILSSYSRWTTLSAVRIGSPIRSKAEVYPLLASVDFQAVLDESKEVISSDDFNKWHHSAVSSIVNYNVRMNGHYGWASKIINIYLKTYCYVGDGGRAGIRDCLHPPIDSGLWKGIKTKFKKNTEIISKTHSTTSISSIDSYDKYLLIIQGLRLAANELGCPLIEVEQLWEGAGDA